MSSTEQAAPARRRGGKVEAVYPLTPAQEGMLYHCLEAPGSGVYVEQLAFQAGEGFDPDLFRQAFEGTMARHPILRTAFSWEKRERPLQVVMRRVALPVEQEDWRSLDEESRTVRRLALLEEDRRRGFELAKPPLVRLFLADCGDEWFCLITYHHLLLDAWSLALVFGELLAELGALSRGEVYRGSAPRPFGDFVRWLEQRPPSAAADFWRQELHGVTTPVRPVLAGEESTAHGDLRHSLDPALGKSLAHLARQHGMTLNTLFQAAWGMVLGRFSGRDDVVFGTAVAGRPPSLEGAEAMVGLFINTVPVRLDMTPEAKLLPWLEALQMRQLERSEHDHAPLADIHGWSAVPRGLPLFESLLVFENVPLSGELGQGAAPFALRELEYSPQTHYDLTLLVVPGDPMTLRLLFRESVCSAAEARRLLDAAEAILREMVAVPERPLGELGRGLGLGLDTVRGALLARSDVRRAALAERADGRPVLLVDLEAGADEVEVARALDQLLMAQGDSALECQLFLAGEPNEAPPAEAAPKLVQETFWAPTLSTLGDELDIPFDHPRRTLEGEPEAQRTVFHHTLSSELVTTLEQRAQALGLPAERLIETALGSLLADFSGSTTLCLAVPFTSAEERGWRALPVPFTAPADSSFEGLALAHGAACDCARVQVGPPAEAPRPAALVLPGTGSMPEEGFAARADLVLRLEPISGEGFALQWFYDSALWHDTSIHRLAQRLEATLEAAVGEEGQELPVRLGPGELQQLLEWNDRQRPYPDNLVPHQLFERQLEATPDAIAVAFGETSLSYRQLGVQVRRLARRLRRLGVGPEVAVGLCVDRSLDMVVGLLGILQAGGVHVPLDPGYPADRLEYMLESSGAVLLLGHGERLDSLPAPHLPRLALDRDAASIAAEDDGPLDTLTVPENLGYIIYTSGSTGRPKGVALSLRVLTNLVVWQLGLTPLPRGGRTLQLNSFSFDVSFLEICAPIAAGETVVMMSEACRRDAEALANLLIDQRIERLITPFTALEHLAERLAEAERLPRSLRHVVSTGEALQITPPVAALFQRLPETRLFNGYGPSETHFVTDHDLGRKIESWPALPSIGRPIPNSTLHVVDSQLRPVVRGGRGEAMLGGITVARGYVGRPAATAEKFIPDPWGPPGSRLYKSGDLARHLRDGVVEYLGRIDHQVKIRGYRVELGEIEVVLRGHDSVAEAAVVARAEAQRLEAFVVPVPDREPSPEALRAYAAERLPEFMVPAFFHALETLPTTPTGKLDRRRLAQLAPTMGEGAERDRSNVTRELLAGLFADLLGLGSVGPEADFFLLGGHSLLATRLAARVRRVFGIELPLGEIFTHPVLGELATRIDALRRQGVAEAEPWKRLPRDGELPLSFAQQRLWLTERLGQGGAAYNLPSGLLLEGPLDVEALSAAFEGLEERHEALRTTFGEEGGQPVQRIAPHRPGRDLPLVDLADFGEDAEAEALRRMAQEARKPFDLSEGPLWCAQLYRLNEHQHALFINLHHIIVDLWSVGLLVGEMSSLYREFAAGNSVTLEPLEFQYADFAAWQRDYLADGVLEAQLDWWRRHLEGAPEQALPLARQDANPKGSDGADHWVFLEPKLLRDLESLGRSSGATLFMTLLAAFEVLIHRHTGATDLVLGTDFANRTQEETEQMVGFFINVLPLRTDLSGRPTFLRLLERVRETALGAHAHQEIPADVLVKELAGDRGGSAASPFFRILFVLQNAPHGALELSELTLRDLPLGTGTSKFDLAIFFDTDGDGLGCRLSYRTACYEASEIERLADRYLALLKRLVANPKVRIDEVPYLTDREQKESTMQVAEKTQKSKSRFSKFQRRRPKAVSLVEEPLVSTRTLTPEGTLPLVVEPAIKDVDLSEWASGNRKFIDEKLRHHGGLLFRGFQVPTVRDFEHFAASASDALYGDYGDLPREDQGKKVYKSTPYPEDKMILFHNESSHMDKWPLKQFFFCVQPSEVGGETPILDCRETYRKLRPSLRDQFEEKGLLYVRNFIEGFDVSWRDFFHTEDRAEVEAKCRETGMTCEWLENDGLRTEQRCPAVVQHPLTGEMLFFNQIQLHHVACLEDEVRESMLSLYSERNLPRHVYFGDGTPIPDEAVNEISQLYQETAVEFTWQKGDVVMLDNMIVAHARNPFKGSRRIAVVMADMFHQSALPALVAEMA